ncbi:MAG TPA: hypothetical protein DFS52_29735 [Myxococcales bacterium]|jgi:hypothetical protein|nr:hypothetical protein [Myxococcales bacterium]
MTKRKHKGEEGAAVAEYALSTLLLVPIALYSMYAGEAFMMAIKAQEAEIAAAWDTTAYRLHSFPSGGHRSLYAQAMSRSEASARAALADFDSFSPRGGRGWKGPITSAELQQLDCELAPEAPEALVTISYDAGGGGGDRSGYIGPLHNDGLVRCRARISLVNHFIPERAHQEFIENSLFPRSIRNLQICGLGPNISGCGSGDDRGLALLTDDWALGDSRANPVGTSRNQAYYRIGELMFRQQTDHGNDYQAGARAVKEAMEVMTGSGVDLGQTDQFKMGYLDRVNSVRSWQDAADSEDRGPRRAHMSAYDNLGDTSNGYGNLFTRIYGMRRNNNYLGMADSHWNGQ